MKKVRLAMAAAALILLAGLSGCGAKAADSSQGSESNQSTQANTDWPKKAINLYITHSSGGDTDYMARQLAQRLEKKLGTSVPCTNVTGSNGATCMQQYKDGAADGYTFIATNTAALNGNEATGLVDFGYESFEPVAVYGIQSGENIVVAADSPYNTLEELIEASKASPNTINFGISTGGGVYIMASVLTHKGGARFNIVESGDAANRLTAILGGDISATSLPYSTAKDYIENGQLKSIATCLSKAPALLPDQAVASDTVPELKLDTEYVILAPKGTPKEIVEAMNKAIMEVGEEDDWKSMVNEYCYQNPFILNVEDTISNLKEQNDLFHTFKDFL